MSIVPMRMSQVSFDIQCPHCGSYIAMDQEDEVVFWFKNDESEEEKNDV